MGASGTRLAQHRPPDRGSKHYIDLCQESDITIDERSEIINKQEKILRRQMRELKRQMEVLKYKKTYYKDMKEKGTDDEKACRKNTPKSKLKP